RASIREPVRSYGSFIHGVTSGSSISDGEAPCSLGKLPSLVPPSSCSASTIPESLAFARLSWLRVPFRFSSDPHRSARANFSQAQKLFAAKIGLTRDKCASGGRSQAVSRGASPRAQVAAAATYQPLPRFLPPQIAEVFIVASRRRR